MALAGCELCSIAMYCNSRGGQCSRNALAAMRRVGFKGILYNAGSATELAAAGFRMDDNSDSVVPACTESGEAACRVVYTGPNQRAPPQSMPAAQPGPQPRPAPATRPRPQPRPAPATRSGGTPTGQGTTIVTARGPGGRRLRHQSKNQKGEAAHAVVQQCA